MRRYPTISGCKATYVSGSSIHFVKDPAHGSNSDFEFLNYAESDNRLFDRCTYIIEQKFGKSREKCAVCVARRSWG